VIDVIRTELRNAVSFSPDQAKRFFKTGAGAYAEGDIFLGVSAPSIRRLAKKYYQDLKINDLDELISSKIHEERALSLIILVLKFDKAKDESQIRLIYDYYLKNMHNINNWDLVDISAHYIIGRYLFDKDRSMLIDLARSDILWNRRIAIVATWYFIRNNDLSWTFKLAKMLIQDKHDLIHKATGWMLREAGKKDRQSLIDFLHAHQDAMPRTMLRYAKERL
jgi:3-methyladenine DNA glycosylase AlkD